jgi:hypothetical protein
MSLSEHQDQISADKLSNNMEVIPPMSLTYATAVVLSERIPICNDFLIICQQKFGLGVLREIFS